MRKIQSEHWSTNQCTLFIGVWQWLDVGPWDLVVGELGVGAEVTVRGEMAGEAKAAGSFWAKVVSKVPRGTEEAEDSYVVEDAAGARSTVARSLLRHRVFIKQCHAGVTGDKKHDRHCIYFSLFCVS